MMKILQKHTGLLLLALILAVFLSIGACGGRIVAPPEPRQPISDHFDGEKYYNPVPSSDGGERSKRGVLGWVWRWLFSTEWPPWPEANDIPPGPPPPARVPPGTLRITPSGHATFLIQIDGLNLLTDPIWSERCSPVSWAGPRRYRPPGIPWEDLPPIDAVLLSHNHYDHLDLPTLERLAQRGTPRSIVPLGNRDLVRESAIPAVDELDWWQSVRLSNSVTVTLVPARHFSSRTLWDRNQTLWGGFVLSGPSGNVFFAGDTGYGPHFREIARRFAPIRAALLPIAPFLPNLPDNPSGQNRLRVHMRPSEAVRAHQDLGAEVSVAAHYRVFRLGPEGYDDAPRELAASLQERGLDSGTFVLLDPGRSLAWAGGREEKGYGTSMFQK